jgi:hypothetical protein
VAFRKDKLDYVRGDIYKTEDYNRIIIFEDVLIRINDFTVFEGTVLSMNRRNVLPKEYFTVLAGYQIKVIHCWMKLIIFTVS